MDEGVRPGRVVSIDALRGFDMFWIIGGAGIVRRLFTVWDTPFSRVIADQMRHKAWNGFAHHDLIFPMFLFIVGASIPYSLGKRCERAGSKGEVLRHILWRGAVLFFLGIVYNQHGGFEGGVRWMGVLQRIALCYTGAAVIALYTRPKMQVFILGAILAGYWLVMTFVPVPGIGAGVLTPEGNLAGYVDRLLLPGRYCCQEFFDNEGILSTVSAIGTALMGVLSGHWLRSGASPGRSALGLTAAGAVSLALALAWSPLFPINKLLWTSSYVLYAGGWSLLHLALFYWLIDVRGYRAWAMPFVVIGMNAITIYFVQAFFDFGIIVNIFLHGVMEPVTAARSVVWLALVLGVKWLFLYWLYRRRIFLKV